MPARVTERDVHRLHEILCDHRGAEQHFDADLYRLIKKADPRDRLLLAQPYPEHVAVIQLWERGAHRALTWEELLRRGVRAEVLTDESNFRGGFNVFGPHGILTPEGRWREDSRDYTVAGTGPVADLKARWMATLAIENPRT